MVSQELASFPPQLMSPTDPSDFNQIGKSRSVSPHSGPGQQSEGSGQTSHTSKRTIDFSTKSRDTGQPKKPTGSQPSTSKIFTPGLEQDGDAKREEGGDKHRQSSIAQDVGSVLQTSSRVPSETQSHISRIGIPATVNGAQCVSHTGTPLLGSSRVSNEGRPGAHYPPEEPGEESIGSVLIAMGLRLLTMGLYRPSGETEENARTRRYTSRLEKENSELNKNLAEVKNEFHGFKEKAQEVIASRERKNRELSSRVQQVEGEMMIHKTQIQNMTKIIAELSQRGLPLPPDDGYFQDEFESIIAELRQWARLFTRGQPPLTLETLKQLEYDSPEQVRLTLLRSFAAPPGIMHFYKALGTKFRTRCVEILLFKRAFEGLLWDSPLGLGDLHHWLNEICNYMGSASAEDRHLWGALSIHLLTQDNKRFDQLRRQNVHCMTAAFLKELEPFGIIGKATPKGLHDIVERISELGLAMHKLPYRILPLMAPKEALRPGSPFQADLMENLESSSESEMELQLKKVPTSLFLCQPWVKVRFTPDGSRLSENYTTIIMKARVSCLE